MIKLTAIYSNKTWNYILLSTNDFEDLVEMGWNKPDGFIFAGTLKGKTMILKGFYYEVVSLKTIFQL
jgi:hypothetical protein